VDVQVLVRFLTTSSGLRFCTLWTFVAQYVLTVVCPFTPRTSFVVIVGNPPTDMANTLSLADTVVLAFVDMMPSSNFLLTSSAPLDTWFGERVRFWGMIMLIGVQV